MTEEHHRDAMSTNPSCLRSLGTTLSNVMQEFTIERRNPYWLLTIGWIPSTSRGDFTVTSRKPNEKTFFHSREGFRTMIPLPGDMVAPVKFVSIYAVRGPGCGRR